jgi:hypothetical protein
MANLSPRTDPAHPAELADILQFGDSDRRRRVINILGGTVRAADRQNFAGRGRLAPSRDGAAHVEACIKGDGGAISWSPAKASVTARRTCWRASSPARSSTVALLFPHLHAV